jgi:hypothetical protein
LPVSWRSVTGGSCCSNMLRVWEVSMPWGPVAPLLCRGPCLRRVWLDASLLGSSAWYRHRQAIE